MYPCSNLIRRRAESGIPHPRTTMLPALFSLLLIIGYGTAAPRHVRGEAARVASEERRNGEDKQQRVLPSLVDYDIKGEDKYSSCPEGYPAFGTLGDLLTAWSPNQPEVPDGGVIERLRVRATARCLGGDCCRQLGSGRTVALPDTAAFSSAHLVGGRRTACTCLVEPQLGAFAACGAEQNSKVGSRSSPKRLHLEAESRSSVLRPRFFASAGGGRDHFCTWSEGALPCVVDGGFHRYRVVRFGSKPDKG